MHPKDPPRDEESWNAAPSRRTVNQLRLTVESLYAREAMLEAVIDSLPVWVSVKGPDGCYLLVNEAMARAHGGRPADFVGRRPEEVDALPAGARRLSAEADAEALATGGPAERPRFYVRQPDGRERIRHLTKIPLSDDEGDVLGVVGWSDDITDAVLAEDALESHRQLLRTVIEAVPYPTAYTGADGRVLMGSPALCRLLGCTAEDVLGRTLRELPGLPAQVYEQLHADTQAAFRAGQAPPPIEYAGADAEGRIHHHVASRAIVRPADGAVEAVVNVAAAFMIMLAEAGLRNVAPAAPPDATLAQLNRQLLQYQLEGRFLSGICLRIAPDGTLDIANAGHPAAILLAGPERRLEGLELGGFPLGWFAEATYRAQTLRLAPGDTVVLYTDGLTEWSDADGRQLSEPGLQVALTRSPRGRPKHLLGHVLAAGARHAGGAAPTDDQTVFVFTYRGTAPR